MLTRPFTLGFEFDSLSNDTEETLMGSSPHQAALAALYTSLERCGSGRGLPWFVGDQIKLIIPRQGPRSFQPSPDIRVHQTLTSGSRESILLTVDGLPALVIEVATAVERELDLTSPTGKAGVYSAIGVREYLVFDPTGDSVGEPVWARRMGPGGYVPWEPDGFGRWFSSTLGIAFEPRDTLLRVYDRDGRLVRLTNELAGRTIEQEQHIADQQRRLAELEAESHKLRGA